MDDGYQMGCGGTTETPLATKRFQAGQRPKCSRCSVNLSDIFVRVDHICRSCFVAALQSRAKRQINVASDVMSGDRVAIALSGGPSSRSLVDLFYTCSHRAQKKTFIDAVLLVVDTTSVQSLWSPHMTSKQATNSLKELLINVLDSTDNPMLVIPLETLWTHQNFKSKQHKTAPLAHWMYTSQDLESYKFGSTYWNGSNTDNVRSLAAQQMNHFFEEITMTSDSRQDMLDAFIQRALWMATKSIGLHKLILGDCAQTLARKVIDTTTKGRGYSLAWYVAERDFRFASMPNETSMSNANEATVSNETSSMPSETSSLSNEASSKPDKASKPLDSKWISQKDLLKAGEASPALMHFLQRCTSTHTTHTNSRIQTTDEPSTSSSPNEVEHITSLPNSATSSSQSPYIGDAGLDLNEANSGQIILNRPFSCFEAKELALYARWNKLHTICTPTFSTKGHERHSLFQATESLLQQLQHSFPGTVHNVLRTAAKLELPTCVQSSPEISTVMKRERTRAVGTLYHKATRAMRNKDKAKHETVHETMENSESQLDHNTTNDDEAADADNDATAAATANATTHANSESRLVHNDDDPHTFALDFFVHLTKQSSQMIDNASKQNINASNTNHPINASNTMHSIIDTMCPLCNCIVELPNAEFHAMDQTNIRKENDDAWITPIVCNGCKVMLRDFGDNTSSTNSATTTIANDASTSTQLTQAADNDTCSKKSMYHIKDSVQSLGLPSSAIVDIAHSLSELYEDPLSNEFDTMHIKSNATNQTNSLRQQIEMFLLDEDDSDVDEE